MNSGIPLRCCRRYSGVRLLPVACLLRLPSSLLSMASVGNGAISIVTDRRRCCRPFTSKCWENTQLNKLNLAFKISLLVKVRVAYS